MSRIGRAPVPVPQGVKCNLKDGQVRIEGPIGKLSMSVPAGIEVKQQGGEIRVETVPGVRLNSREFSARHGLVRALIRNMVEGVTKGYERKIEVMGAGYRPTVQGTKLSIMLGFSHPIVVDMPAGVKVTAARVEAGGRGEERHVITLSGCDKAEVGELAARIRRIKRADVYKGKGMRYAGEIVKRKPGKAAVATAGGAGK